MNHYADNLLETIADALPDLNKSERKVADVILANPEAATTATIAALAKAASVSEPSVNRFCKRFDAKGFPEFKVLLARSLPAGIRFVTASVKPDDGVGAYTNKIFDSSINALAAVRESIDHRAIEAAVDQLLQARRIYCLGLGASGAVAKDAEHKFFRFNLPVSYHEDVLLQRMLAADSSAGDVFFMISNTGRTRDIVATAALAREQGASVIGLTAPGSPLADNCDLVIGIDESEDTDQYMPMTSRLVHLVVLDVLATGVTLRRGPEFLPHLQKIKHSLKPTRFAPETGEPAEP